MWRKREGFLVPVQACTWVSCGCCCLSRNITQAQRLLGFYFFIVAIRGRFTPENMSMYQVKPIYEGGTKIDLPTCMYKLPNVHEQRASSCFSEHAHQVTNLAPNDNSDPHISFNITSLIGNRTCSLAGCKSGSKTSSRWGWCNVTSSLVSVSTMFWYCYMERITLLQPTFLIVWW